MASRAHQFIADLISNKMYMDGFEVISFDGLDSYEDVKLKLPPKILRHRPDLIGVKKNGLAIGEAKTANDLSARTKEQLLDFVEFHQVKTLEYKVYFGIPISIEDQFKSLIGSLEIDQNNLVILTVPDRLLPYEDNYKI